MNLIELNKYMNILSIRLLIILIAYTLAYPIQSQDKYGIAHTKDSTTQIPRSIEPEFDYWMRDTWVSLGPDEYYYLTGTTAALNRYFTGQMHCWDWNDGIYLWRSKDLKEWESMGLIWSMEKDGTWQKGPRIYSKNEVYPKTSINGDLLDNRFHAVWAPEIHFIESVKNWFIVACLNESAGGRGSFILKSTTGKPEGPYVNIEANREGPLFPQIDGSLFEDEDGTVYFVGHNHYIAKMKADISGFEESIIKLEEQQFDPEPYIEGAFIFKHDNKYHLVQAIWSHRLNDGTDTYSPLTDSNETRYSYDCIIASSDNIYGPYSKRYNALTGGGHNNFFKDKNGEWWATIFFNPRGAQASEFKRTCRPGIVPMEYKDGKFYPANRSK